MNVIDGCPIPRKIHIRGRLQESLDHFVVIDDIQYLRGECSTKPPEADVVQRSKFYNYYNTNIFTFVWP